MKKAVFSWSSGKDSALSLYKILTEHQYEISMLFTTLSEHNRVGFHGVRTVLLEEQARALNLPLTVARIPTCQTVEEYGTYLKSALRQFPKTDINHIIYGDIFLEDLKEYRLKLLSDLNITGVFPIWKKDSKELLLEFIELGFKAVITCIDSKLLPYDFAGMEIDQNFLQNLPSHVDPCGENGEFHTFVYDGPNFAYPIRFNKGETILRYSFYYLDLIPMDYQSSDRNALP